MEVASGENVEKRSFYATEIPRPLFWKPFGMFDSDNSGSYDISGVDSGHATVGGGFSSYMVEPNVIVKHVRTVIK